MPINGLCNHSTNNKGYWKHLKSLDRSPGTGFKILIEESIFSLTKCTIIYALRVYN